MYACLLHGARDQEAPIQSSACRPCAGCCTLEPETFLLFPPPCGSLTSSASSSTWSYIQLSTVGPQPTRREYSDQLIDSSASFSRVSTTTPSSRPVELPSRASPAAGARERGGVETESSFPQGAGPPTARQPPLDNRSPTYLLPPGGRVAQIIRLNLSPLMH